MDAMLRVLNNLIVVLNLFTANPAVMCTSICTPALHTPPKTGMRITRASTTASQLFSFSSDCRYIARTLPTCSFSRKRNLLRNEFLDNETTYE